jgi:hypothetical protein
MLTIKLLRDVTAEWCWRRCCRDDLVAVLCRCRVMLTMTLMSHAEDDIAESCDEDAESC